MSVGRIETVDVSELGRIERWRQEELERAGYDAKSAQVLAANHDIDLHEAADLLKKGCSVDLALQILL